MDHSFLHLLQTTDSTFPVGGFAHSYGLEGMVLNGTITNSTGLGSYIENSWLPSITHTDLPLIRLCADAANDDHTLFHLDELATACRAASEIRKAQKQMGSQRLTLLAQLTEHRRLTELDEYAKANRWAANWSSVWGVEAALLQLPLEHSMQAYGFQGLSGLLAAALKLLSIGPREAQQMLNTYLKLLPEAIEQSHSITEENIGWFTPALDIATSQHEHTYSRIFIS